MTTTQSKTFSSASVCRPRVHEPLSSVGGPGCSPTPTSLVHERSWRRQTRELAKGLFDRAMAGDEQVQLSPAGTARAYLAVIDRPRRGRSPLRTGSSCPGASKGLPPKFLIPVDAPCGYPRGADRSRPPSTARARLLRSVLRRAAHGNYMGALACASGRKGPCGGRRIWMPLWCDGARRRPSIGR